MIEAPFYPIVLIGDRDGGGDPFRGFNRGRPEAFDRPAFAGLVMELATEHGYVPALDADPVPGSVPPRSLWPFTPGHVDDPVADQAAALGRFLARVREGVCDDDPVRLEAFRVILVGHGVGGLVARCFLQNGGIPGPDGPTDPETKRALVDKLVTLGSEHARPAAEIRRAMTLEAFEPANGTAGRLDAERILCIGAGADPTTPIEGCAAANVPGIAAHLPASPEAYRNLERFCFGSLRVDLLLKLDQAELPKGLEEDGTEATYSIEVQAGLRGQREVLHVARDEQGTALRHRRTGFEARPVPLTSLVLNPAGRVQRRRQSVGFGADLRILASYEQDGRPWRDDQFPGMPLWAEGIEIELTPKDGSFKLLYRFASAAGKKSVDVVVDDGGDSCTAEIPFERKAKPHLSGTLLLRISHWNQPQGDYLVLVNE